MEEMIIVEFFLSDSWKTSNSEFGILLGVERKCDSVVTKKELDMLRFYGGDIRKRTEEGKLLIINSSENSKDPKDLLWRDKDAYRTLDALLFDGYENEKERIFQEHH